MKIFFRYLFLRLFVPFAVVFCACTLIWVMADLYGNIDDFLEHKINILLILGFYSLQFPNILVQVLPATLMIATLWTLLSLNRRCELVAFQSGGMAPIWLFTPFFAFACIWVLILAVDLNWLAAPAEVTRERLLDQVKGQNDNSNTNLPYVDKVNRRVWFFQSLDTRRETAKGVAITQHDADGHVEQYIANTARWNGEFWHLSGVKEIVYNPDDSVQSQKIFEQIDLPDMTTSPKLIALMVSQPEQLTLAGLSQYISTSTASPGHLAGYRTEWWYRVLYPFSLIILMLFALYHGTRTDRRGPVVGVVWAIVILLLYILLINGCIALGKHGRIPPFLSVIAMEAVFGAIGLHLLALSNGWWWQLLEVGKRWQARWAGDEAPSEDGTE